MNVKQVIVIRKDLNMRKGKMVAQGAHASMGAIFSIANKEYFSLHVPILTEAMRSWIYGKFTKVCVSVDSEQELVDLYNQAKTAGLISCLIEDAGLTEFGGVPTKTALAIGPDQSEKIDVITGHLKLL